MEAPNNNNNNNKNPKNRMIQIKWGNQEAKSMLPHEAAEYLQSVASMGGNKGRDLRVQFGNMMQDSSSSSTRNSNALPKKQPGLPCTEKEMKALMSMFVEIMGLQMNTERLNETNPPPANNLFQFPTDVPPPPGGWPDDLTWPNTETLPPLSDTVDEDSSLEGLPALEEIPKEAKRAVAAVHLTLPEEDEKVTGMQGIARFEWDALERVAVEEALEHEERTRKNFRRSKKEKVASMMPNEATKKVEELNQAALQKAEQLYLARKKAIVSWRNAVTATFHQVCQNSSTSVSMLQEILEQSPLLQDYDKANPLEPHLEDLLPLFVRHRQKGPAARLCLAQFILRLRPLLLVTPIPTIGRSVLHNASWWGEGELVDHICQVYKAVNEYLQKGGKKKSEKVASNNLWPVDTSSTIRLDETCQESGWSAVHYAAITGNLVVLEVLLRSGCKVDTKTNSSHTWSKTTGNGITAHELVQGALSKVNDVETLGTAWLEISKEHKNTQKRYTTFLSKVSSRLEDVASGLLEKTTLADVQREVVTIERELEKEESLAKKDDVSTNTSSNNDTKSSKSSLGDAKEEEIVVPGKRVRKKKKKPLEESPAIEGSKPSAVNSTTSSVVQREDPVVTALLGMGFQKDEVQAAISACGGHDRATVDNVVAWIFGQQGSGDNIIPVSRPEMQTRSNQEDAWSSKQPKKKESKQAESLRVDEKLAMRKEEQHPRNSDGANRQGIVSRVNEPKALKPSKAAFPLLPETHPDLRKVSPPIPKVREEQSSRAGLHISNNGTHLEPPTAISSIEHRTIEIFNDDATVSTLGSIATRSTIVPHSSAPPPGFHVPPTMLEEPLSPNWMSYGSHSGPPPAISESMVMQSLGLHTSPVVPIPPPAYRSPLEHQASLDSHQHQQQFMDYNRHHDRGYGDFNGITGGLNHQNTHFSQGHPTRHALHHHTDHGHSQHHQYSSGLSAPHPFFDSNSNYRNDNNGLGSSFFPPLNAPDPLVGLSGLATPEPNDFPLPLGLGLEKFEREHEGTSLWDNQALPLRSDHVENSLGVSLFGLSNDEKKKPPSWSGDGLGGSIW